MIDAIKDKIVVKLMTRDKTKSGIIIPDSIQEPQAFCKVLSVGNEVENVKVDDIIVCHMRSGMDVVIDKDIIKVLKEDEVYGQLIDKATLKSLKSLDITKKYSTNNSKKIISI